MHTSYPGFLKFYLVGYHNYLNPASLDCLQIGKYIFRSYVDVYLLKIEIEIASN